MFLSYSLRAVVRSISLQSRGKTMCKDKRKALEEALTLEALSSGDARRAAKAIIKRLIAS